MWRSRVAELRWPANLWRWTRLAISAVVAAFIGIALLAAWTARRIEGEPVQLAFPVRDAPAYVTHGGSNAMTNHHAASQAQRHALDITALGGPLGTRARGVLPERPQDYAAFGLPVHAPCSGEVVQARGHLADQVPPRVDTMHLFGNYLAVHCAGATVVMAHLQGGSVTVANGDQVKVGQLLGRVGNTGHSTEPHLHMHAVRGRVVDPEILGAKGDPVPMVFGRARAYLVRHDVVQPGSDAHQL